MGNESPLNPGWIQRHPDKAPDLQYNPWTLTVFRSQGKEIVYVAGEPSAAANMVAYIRRVDIDHVSIGTGENDHYKPDSTCPRVADYIVHQSLPITAAGCRSFSSGNGSYVA